MPKADSNSKAGAVGVRDLTGTTVGRFAVRKRLGTGGMGEVYRADDMKLRRPVALKRVAPSLGDDPGYRNRFLKEAQRASSLSNPHIAAVYDVLEENGEIYVVMEYVEGETLRQRMKEPVWTKDFFEIATQCGEALVEAHAKGIVHRDIKPENIMLTRSGKVKILDFGVARKLPSAKTGETTVTSNSVSIGLSGTPAYMAPEVLLEKESDGRADLFSLGVVLYEAITGAHPFRAGSFMATCDRILREAPTPLHERNPDVAPPVEQVISKLLAKDPAGRYSSAQEMLAELDRLRSPGGIPELGMPRRRRRAALTWIIAAAVVLGGLAAVPAARQQAKIWLGLSVVPETKQLVVLPFTAVGSDPQTEAFGEGLTETLTAKLTQLTERQSLQVVPAREARASKVNSVEQARAEFGVNLVLEGSLQASGETVRVTYALVDAVSRRQLRAETITVPASDPFAMADQVVEGVLSMLELELSAEERTSLTRRDTQVAGAFDFYTQGRGYLQDYDRPENIDNALTVFRRALELDPDYALAHTGMGEAYWKKYEATHDSQWVGKAREECKRALRLNATLSAAHICLGTLLNGTGQYDQAIEEWERAVQLEPTNDDAYRGLGAAYENLGKIQQAEQTYRHAIELRPYYWGGYTWLGTLYFRQGRYPEAVEMFRQVVELVPDSFLGYANLGGVYVVQGRYPDAIQALEKSVAIRPTARAYTNLGTAYFYLRRYGDAARTYEGAVKLEERNPIHWWNLAEAYYWAPGRRPEAAGAYRKALELIGEKLLVNSKDVELLGVAAVCHAMLGERQTALGTLHRALLLAPGNLDLNFNAAVVYAQFGETDAALSALEKALAGGLSPSQVRDTPNFDALRNEPRLRKILDGE